MGLSGGMILLIIVVVGALFYMNSRPEVVEKSVYYPVYKTEYVNRDRPRPLPRRRPLPRPRPRPVRPMPGSKQIPPGTMPKPHDHEDTLHFISGVATPDP